MSRRPWMRHDWGPAGPRRAERRSTPWARYGTKAAGDNCRGRDCLVATADANRGLATRPRQGLVVSHGALSGPRRRPRSRPARLQNTGSAYEEAPMSACGRASTAIVGSPPRSAPIHGLVNAGLRDQEWRRTLSPFAKSGPQTRVSARRGEARNQPGRRLTFGG